MSDSLHFVRRIRTSPYFNRVKAAGISSFSVYNHMLLPKTFAMSVEDAYWHLNTHVQIWDVSVQRQVEIKGPDAARLVQWITPRDLSQATPERCYYIPVVDQSGGMLNDPVLQMLDQDHYWLSIADSDLLLYIKGLAIAGGFDVNVQEPDVNPLAIQGPKAADVMADLFGEAIRSLTFFQATTIDIFGSKQRVTRSGFSAKAGYEIYVDDRSLAEPLWDMIQDAGQAYQMAAGGPNLIDRMEAGLLGYGNEMTPENNPLEMGYERFCTLDGSVDCIGLAALQRIQRDGIKRSIRGVKFDGAPCPPCSQPWPVTHQGQKIGQITSAVWSPRLQCNIGLSLIDRGYWNPGQEVDITLPQGDRVKGQVSHLPSD